jgi:hypothetical protein
LSTTAQSNLRWLTQALERKDPYQAQTYAPKVEESLDLIKK